MYFFFFFPFRSLIIIISPSTQNAIYHYSILLIAFQCAVNKVVLLSRYHRHAHPASLVFNKWIITRNHRQTTIFWDGFISTYPTADQGECSWTFVSDYIRIIRDYVQLFRDATYQESGIVSLNFKLLSRSLSLNIIATFYQKH